MPQERARPDGSAFVRRNSNGEGIDLVRILRKYVRRMRSSTTLDALFPAVRQKVLAATLLSPEKSWYLSELAEHLGTSPSSLQREVKALADGGILDRMQDGRRVYYRAQTASPVFKELHDLFSKTAGIIPFLKSALRQLGHKIKWAAVYGSIARGEEQPESDIDLLIVGSLGMIELVPTLRRVEKRFGREVNVTEFSESEFRTKRRDGSHFLNHILKTKFITVAGSPAALEGTRVKSSSPDAAR
jgi:predicted nucleotidyltransferase